jgi:hypothetical protein
MMFNDILRVLVVFVSHEPVILAISVADSTPTIQAGRWRRQTTPGATAADVIISS